MNSTHTHDSTNLPALRITQLLLIIATGIVSWGLYQQSETTLNLFWNLVIPLLPITFLISPILWRSLCPLATLTMLSNGRPTQRTLPVSALSKAGTASIIVLVILVPARRFLLNESGMGLIGLIAITAIAAIILGFMFDAKAGFCNAICPILPVEKLYGQHPLIEVRNPRCATCTLCTPKGCIDIAPKKSIAQAIGRPLRSHNWLRTPYGIFAAAFPGFIAGYFTIADGPFSSAGTVYLHIAFFTVIGYLITVSIVLLLNASSVYMLPLLAATSIGLYYWFATPLILSVFDHTGAGVIILRSLIFAFVGFWLARAIHKVHLRPFRPRIA